MDKETDRQTDRQTDGQTDSKRADYRDREEERRSRKRPKERERKENRLCPVITSLRNKKNFHKTKRVTAGEEFQNDQPILSFNEC